MAVLGAVWVAGGAASGEPDAPPALAASTDASPLDPDRPGFPGSEPSPAPTPAPAAPIATSATSPATGALNAPAALPIAPSRECGESEGAEPGATRGATASRIETGWGFVACVAMGLR